MRERWGTFSVRDHLSDAPFVSDVLLYDRLIIPVPPADGSEGEFWKEFKPDEQRRCLEILKIKTDKEDGLALTVEWDASKRDRFKNRMSAAAAIATQKRNQEQGYYMDPFKLTRELVKDEFLPALPPGVSKAWTVAAYTSTGAFRQELSVADPDRRHRQLAMKITHRFLTPAESDPNHEILKRAVDLSTSDDFRRKRTNFYAWQEGIIEEQISDENAINELENYLNEYNGAIRRAFKKVKSKFAFVVIPISLAMTGALISGSKAGIVIAGAGSLVQLTRFWIFDRKPDIEAGDFDAAAMIHDARKRLPLKR